MHLPGLEVDAHASSNEAGRHLRAALRMILVVGLAAGIVAGSRAMARTNDATAGPREAASGPKDVAAGPATVAPEAPTQTGEIIGVPWTGEPGITETVAQIM